MDIQKEIQYYLLGAGDLEEKVCLPLNTTLGANEFSIAKNLNHASHYSVVDFKKAESYITELSEMKEIFSNGNGLGFKVLDISSIICGGISVMAHKLLQDSDISVFKAEGNNIIHNLQMFAEKQLVEFSISDAVSSNSCSISCSSCSTSCV